MCLKLGGKFMSSIFLLVKATKVFVVDSGTYSGDWDEDYPIGVGTITLSNGQSCFLDIAD